MASFNGWIISIENDDANGTVDGSNNSATHISRPVGDIYLPTIFKGFVPAPDLTINSFVVSQNQVTITLRNIGTATVGDAFWIQILLNPSSPPNQLNQFWDVLTANGAMWGVSSPNIPPNGTITLNLNDQYYVGQCFVKLRHSRFA